MLLPLAVWAPFFFPQVRNELQGTVRQWDIPLGEWMELRFEQGKDETLGNTISRLIEDSTSDSGSILTLEEANKEFGIPGHLVFHGQVATKRAKLLNERKVLELRRIAQFNGAAHSNSSFKAFAGFCANLAGHLAHPVDFVLIAILLTWLYRRLRSVFRPLQTTNPTQAPLTAVAPTVGREPPTASYDDSTSPEPGQY